MYKGTLGFREIHKFTSRMNTTLGPLSFFLSTYIFKGGFRGTDIKSPSSKIKRYK